jgi:molecular chaperone GrpE
MTKPKTNPDTADDASPEDALSDDLASAVLENVDELRTKAAERDKYYDLWLRERAEFDNYQKRAQRDLATERRFALAPLALDILPAIDNLERATAAAKQANETGPLVQGVAMVLAQLYDLLRRHGITPIDAEGQPFDPNLHEAVMQQPTAEHPPQTVLQAVERGFRMHDRVLRPAKVIVSTSSEEKEK